MADARMTALRGLSEVFGQGGYSNLVLERLMRNNELSGQERAFCTALFYGVVERRITLDWVLGRYSRQPVEKPCGISCGWRYISFCICPPSRKAPPSMRR